MPDLDALITEVATSTGIHIERDDPAVAFVILTELVLDQVTGRVLDSINRRLAVFELSMEKVDERAGKLLAQEVRNAAEQIRGELHADIDEAGLKAAHLVYKVHEAHSRPALIRWLSAGLASAVVLFLAGLWAGAHFLIHVTAR